MKELVVLTTLTKTLPKQAGRCAWLFALLLGAAVGLQAQFSSVLEGTISDPAQAVIPDVEVKIEDISTGTGRTVTTSGSGAYRATGLAASTYTVTVTAEGFQTHVQERVTLEVAQTTTLNIEMELGQTTTTVSVTSESPLIQTGEATVSGQIQEMEVADLPLVGRNFMTLVVLAPGVVGLPSGGGQAYAQATGDIFSAEYGVNLSGNGQRAESNSFNVDGASVNAAPRGGVVNHSPSADSVQELRVSLNNFSAEYGRNSSVLVNVVTKGGTNDIHGTVGWYHTNNKLQSRNLFQPDVPTFRRNEANWTLGGPIVKNRTFAFVSMDGLRSGVGAGFSNTVVSRQFANLVKQKYPNNISSFVMGEFPDILVNKTVGQTAGDLLGGGCSGSQPIMSPIGELPCDFAVTERGSFAQTLPRDGLQWSVRIDHNLNEGKDRIYGSIARTTNQQVLFGSPSVYPAFTQMQEQWTAFSNINWAHIASANVINEMAWSWQHAEGDAPIGRGEIPAINVPGIVSYGQGFSDAVFIQNNQQWRNVTTWNKGSHSFKFGGNYNCDSGCPGAGALFAPVWERPNYGFNNLFDFALDDPFSHNNIGFDPVTGESRGFDFRPRFTNLGLFFNDDWKVAPNLTISWGVRWEAFFVPSDLDDIFVGAQIRSGGNFMERISDIGIVQGPPLASTDMNNFAPRMGIAWDPTGKGKMSIRAGSGMFYDRPGGQFFRDCCTSLPIFAVANVNKQTVAQPVYGLSSTSESPWNFPRPPDLRVGLDERGGLIGVPAAIQLWEPHLKNQYAINWFFGIQRSLGRDWAIEANYVGSQGTKLYQNYEVNRFSGDLLDGRLDRLNPSFGSIAYGQNNGKSYYHGANASIKKRFSQGLLFQGAYTYGKAIDTASSFSGQAPVDQFNMRLNRGRSRFDVRQKLAMSWIYDIPSPVKSAAGKAILGGWQLGGTTILQSGSPFGVSCGLPFSPVFDDGGSMIGNNGCDFNADGLNNDFPDTPSFGNTVADPSKQKYLNGLFKQSDFPRPQTVRPGNLGRNTFTNPGFANVDFNLLKQIPAPFFGEAGRIDFRAEFFNLFNRVNLNSVNSSLTSGNFGRVTSTFGARNIQFGIKIRF
jgi:hypothetical protein